MLTGHIVYESAVLTDMITNANKTAVGVPGGMLDVLASSVHLPVLSPDESMNPIPREEKVIDGAKFQMGEVAMHDLALSDLSDQLALRTGNIIHLAHNVVVPHIRSIRDEVSTTVAEGANSIAKSHSVVWVTFDELFDNSIFQSVVEQYASSTPTVLNIPFSFPLYSGDDLVGKMLTGSSLLDNDILLFANNLGKEFIADVYNSLFTKAINKYSLESFITAPEKTNATIVAYLIARYFATNGEIPDGINASLAQYQEWVQILVSELGRRLIAIQTARENYSKLKTIVFDYPASKVEGIILANGDLKDVWETGGGVDEILLGSALKEQVVNMDHLLANKGYFCNEWQMLLSVRANTVRAMKDTLTVQALRLATYAYIDRTDEAKLPAPRLELKERANVFLENKTNINSDSLDHFTTDLVYHVFYADTDVKIILDEMHRENLLNPGRDQSEVALIAYINYVTYAVSKEIILA